MIGRFAFAPVVNSAAPGALSGWWAHQDIHVGVTPSADSAPGQFESIVVARRMVPRGVFAIEREEYIELIAPEEADPPTEGFGLPRPRDLYEEILRALG